MHDGHVLMCIPFRMLYLPPTLLGHDILGTNFYYLLIYLLII